MDLRFSPAENAFREELRRFFTTEVPAAIRKKVADGHHLDKADIVAAHKALHKKGYAVPHWPKEWGGADWTAVEHYIYTEELQFTGETWAQSVLPAKTVGEAGVPATSPEMAPIGESG